LFIAFIAVIFAPTIGAEFGATRAAADAVVHFLVCAVLAFRKRRHIKALIRSAAGLTAVFGYNSLVLA
jgi:hypothetical protein